MRYFKSVYSGDLFAIENVSRFTIDRFSASGVGQMSLNAVCDAEAVTIAICSCRKYCEELRDLLISWAMSDESSIYVMKYIRKD